MASLIKVVRGFLAGLGALVREVRRMARDNDPEARALGDLFRPKRKPKRRR